MTVRFSTEKRQGGKNCSWLVKVDDEIVGRVDKLRNSRREEHPWKVFRCMNQGEPLRFKLVAEVYARQCRRSDDLMPTPALLGSRSEAMRLAAYGMEQ